MSASTSIVIPVHNNAALTRACLDAVLADLGPDREAIVVDDASSDTTPELLDGYGDRVRRLIHSRNGGYARACNGGAALAGGEWLVFLNNDTVPRLGWLDALERHAREHSAAAVGAKLLYPNGAVQHAGVAIGQDGYPHNLYAGMPAEHPAVNRSRPLQAVTGACLLVERAAFERVGGFDTGFVNSLEDVDLCLRLGEAGGEVRYCHEAVVTHMESASRGRRDRFQRSVALYRERWRDRVRRDDVSIYVEDGLLEFEYADSYPLRLSVSPRLATVAGGGRGEEVEGLLEAYARQVSDLLGEVVRLTAASGGELGPARDRHATPFADTVTGFDRRDFVREASRLEGMVEGLQQRLEAGTGPVAGAPPQPEFTANDQLGYRRLVEQVRDVVAREVPVGAAVLVVSRGDRELVDLGPRVAAHFPQDPAGGYLGHHPGDSADAIVRLEELRVAGAEYLVLPATSSWWLEHYAGFAAHLGRRYAATEAEACTIFELGSSLDEGALREVAG